MPPAIGAKRLTSNIMMTSPSRSLKPFLLAHLMSRDSMDLSIYKIIHIAGMITLFFAFGGLTLGARMTGSRVFPHKRLYVLLHGVGLLLLIVSGFGQLAKLNLT